MVTLRVQQGNLRGKKIAVAAGGLGKNNFTPAIVKEAVFQILRHYIDEKPEKWAFFDLCAGSGQMALEALSLGFGPVHLCEVDEHRLRNIRSQFRHCYPIQIHRRDFRRMPSRILSYAKSALFLDLPYTFWRAGVSESLDRFLFQLSQPFTERQNSKQQQMEQQKGQQQAEQQEGQQHAEQIILVIQGPDYYHPDSAICDHNFSLKKNYRRHRGVHLSLLELRH